MATHRTLGCDARDPQFLADFWAKALGYIAEPGYDDPDGASIIDPEGKGPAIGWFQVPEPKTAKNRPTSTSGLPARGHGIGRSVSA
jgi:hypothetical protein